MSAFPNISYTFIGQITLPSFIAEMKNPKDFPKALWAVTICEVVVFTLCGAIMYHYVGDQYMTAPAFGSLVDPYKKIAFSFANPTIAFLGALYSSVSTRSLFFRLFRNSHHLYSNIVVGWTAWVGIVAATWVLAFVIAEVIPFFSDMLSLMSSLFDCWFGFIFWGVAYLSLYTGQSRWAGKWRSAETVFNYVIIVFGFYILVAGTYTSVKSIIIDYTDICIRHDMNTSAEQSQVSESLCPDEELFPKSLPALPEEFKRYTSYCGIIITQEHVDHLQGVLVKIEEEEGMGKIFVTYDTPILATMAIFYLTPKWRGGGGWVIDRGERAVCAVFGRNVWKNRDFVEQDCRHSLEESREMIKLLGLKPEEMELRWYLDAPKQSQVRQKPRLQDEDLFPKSLPAIPEGWKRYNCYCGWIITQEHVNNLKIALAKLEKEEGVALLHYDTPFEAVTEAIFNLIPKWRGEGGWVMDGGERVVCAVLRRNVWEDGDFVEQDYRHSLKDSKKMIELLGIKTDEVKPRWYLGARSGR